MTQAALWDAQTDSVVEFDTDDVPLSELLRMVLERRSGRGYPAVELVLESGASLTLGTDGRRAVLIWTNELEESFVSVGDHEDGPALVYDYMGSWSEAQATTLVSLQNALSCAQTFLATGAPDLDRVIFSPS